MDVFSAGDTAWILVCTLLVLLMSIPAVAFFYGGLSKKKNVLNTMFLSFIAFSILSVIWVIFGYQFAFGEPSLYGFIGSPTNFLLKGIGLNDLTGSIPTLVFSFLCSAIISSNGIRLSTYGCGVLLPPPVGGFKTDKVKF